MEEIDCPDGSDERWEAKEIIQTPWHQVCDSVQDTIDNTDEELCNKQLITSRITTLNATDTTSDNNITLSGYFLCKDSLKYIPIDWVDDLIPDCPIINYQGTLAEDESVLVNLDNKLCQNASHLPCLTGHHRCYPIQSLCRYDLDKYGHLQPCRNGAHLSHCNVISCDSMFLCPASYCLPVVRVCDGVRDC